MLKVLPAKWRASWTIVYGIIYGGFVAGAYLFVKLHGHDGGLSLFAAITGIAFILHLIVWPRITLQGLVDRKMLFRGLLYGVTQVLIFKAQRNGFTSTALVSSTMGSIFGVILGRTILKERVQGIGLLAVILCFAAVFINPILVIKSYWGVLGGLIQGSGFVLARSLMLNQKSIRQSISTGFAIAFLVALAALNINHTAPIGFLSIRLFDILVALSILLIVQYGFFYLYKILDSQRASILTLSRLPWAFSLEHIILNSIIPMGQIVSCCLVAGASGVLVLESQKGSKLESRFR